MANSEDPDQMLQNAASDLGLHCLLRPIPIFRIIKVICQLSILTMTSLPVHELAIQMVTAATVSLSISEFRFNSPNFISNRIFKPYFHA